MRTKPGTGKRGPVTPAKTPIKNPGLKQARRDRILLGLAIMEATLKPGPRTQTEIAAFCGITRGGVSMIEQAVLQKLRKLLFLRSNPVLIELLGSLGKGLDA